MIEFGNPSAGKVKMKISYIHIRRGAIWMAVKMKLTDVRRRGKT
jgi:hypothetical protein